MNRFIKHDDLSYELQLTKVGCWILCGLTSHFSHDKLLGWVELEYHHSQLHQPRIPPLLLLPAMVLVHIFINLFLLELYIILKSRLSREKVVVTHM